MKIECVKDRLTEAVGLAEKITGKNLTLPVLACVLLEAKDHNLIIRSTNLDLGVEIVIPVKVEKEGKVAVPGSILNNFLSNLYNSKNVFIEVMDGNLHVSTNHNSTIIKSLPVEDFPTIPHVSGDIVFKFAPKEFIRGLKSVWYSAASSSMKPELSSVYIYPDNDLVVFVATDSFRLAEKKVKIKKVPEFSHILIPFKNIPEIIRVLETVTDDCEISISKNQISFEAPGFYLSSRVIDGTFPDYKQIIPKERKTEAVVIKQDLINSLKVANVFSDKFNQLNIKAEPNHKLFQLKTRNAEVGENSNNLDAALEGEDIEINFNYRYIVDSFQSISTDSVALQFNGHNKPLVIRGVGDSSFMYLVMPMNK
jgi:DNA polymerase III subunit beta